MARQILQISKLSAKIKKQVRDKLVEFVQSNLADEGSQEIVIDGNEFVVSYKIERRARFVDGDELRRKIKERNAELSEFEIDGLIHEAECEQAKNAMERGELIIF